MKGIKHILEFIGEVLGKEIKAQAIYRYCKRNKITMAQYVIVMLYKRFEEKKASDPHTTPQQP